MLQPLEQVFFLDSKGNEYPGTVLGCETEDFWLLVTDLGNLYQGHPDTVANLPDKKVFWIYDRCKPVTSLFNNNGEFISDIFYGAKDAEPMIKLLKVHAALLTLK